jgi:hypothetical protein
MNFRGNSWGIHIIIISLMIALGIGFFSFGLLISYRDSYHQREVNESVIVKDKPSSTFTGYEKISERLHEFASQNQPSDENKGAIVFTEDESGLITEDKKEKFSSLMILQEEVSQMQERCGEKRREPESEVSLEDQISEQSFREACRRTEERMDRLADLMYRQQKLEEEFQKKPRKPSLSSVQRLRETKAPECLF